MIRRPNGRSLSATIPGNPLPKGRPRIAGRRVMRTPKRTREYEKHVKTWVQHEALKQKFTEPFDGPVAMKAVFYRRTRHRCDLDNLEKALKDGITKSGVWHDDSQVKSMNTQVKVDAEFPRTEMVVYEVETEDWEQLGLY